MSLIIIHEPCPDSSKKLKTALHCRAFGEPILQGSFHFESGEFSFTGCHGVTRRPQGRFTKFATSSLHLVRITHSTLPNPPLASDTTQSPFLISSTRFITILSFPSTLVCTSDEPAKQGPAAQEYDAIEKFWRAGAAARDREDDVALLGFGGGSFTNRSSAA